MRITIVGGGLVGMFSAYYLLKSGYRVTLIDLDPGGVKTSIYNAGLVSPSFSPLPISGLMDLVTFTFRKRGVVNVSLNEVLGNLRWFYRMVKSSRRGVDPKPLIQLGEISLRLYKEFLEREHVDIDVIEGIVGLHYNEAEAREAAETLGGKFIDESECRDLGFSDVAAGVFYPEDLSINPARLYNALRSLLADLGAKIILGEAALIKDGNRVYAVAKGSRIVSDYVVVSAGSWSTKLCKKVDYNPMILPARGLVLLFECGGESILRAPGFVEDLGIGLIQHGAAGPLRVTGFFEIVGFNPKFEDSKVDWLINQARKHIVKREHLRLTEKGVGFRPCTPDMKPVIGWVPGCENLIIASGHCRLGVTLAPATGLTVESLISGEKRIELDLSPFNPSRFL